MARICAFALIALCCLAAIIDATPLRNDAEGARARRPATRRYLARRGGRPGLYAARTNQAPVYTAPEETAEEEQPAEEPADEPLQDEPQEEEAPPAPVKRIGGRARPQRPASGEDSGAPPAYSGGQRPGATAIATSYSRGDGAISNSHAVAYDGNFSGGQFKHRYGNGSGKPNKN